MTRTRLASLTLLALAAIAAALLVPIATSARSDVSGAVLPASGGYSAVVQDDAAKVAPADAARPSTADAAKARAGDAPAAPQGDVAKPPSGMATQAPPRETAPPMPGAPPGPPPAPRRPPLPSEKAEEYFKNIQVLKGHPADQVIPMMQFISASLGQDCEFCHVERANEKDDKKEKLTARKMITMTLAINRDSFEGKREVTCNSCHNGQARPAATPAVADEKTILEQALEEPGGKPAELPAVEAVLDKYLRAAGGAEAIAKITSRVQKGTMSGFGPQPMPIEVYSQGPGKRISIVHTPRGDSITAFGGTTGWLGNSGRPPRDMSPAESESARLDADLGFPAHVKQLFKEIKAGPSEKIDGHDTVHLVARNEGKPPVELWFDAQSGFLVRMRRYADTPIGMNPTEIDYRDYKDSGGVAIPFRWTVARPGTRFEIKIDSVEQNVPIEASRFEKPEKP